MKIAVWNYYEELTKDGFLFKNKEASIGAELLSVWNKIYDFGRQHGIEFYTLDQVEELLSIDAVIFMDHPRMDNSLVQQVMQSSVKKYLITFENEVIKPDNWLDQNHKLYDRVFTWNDDYVDTQKYIKVNYTIPRSFLKELEEVKLQWSDRKLLCMINGAKMVSHPLELYSQRINIINFFEAIDSNEFDLYGNGWDRFNLKCYKGITSKKLETLNNYKYCIAFENATGFNGYITEKILDCFRAGVVPIYYGAPNIGKWISANCFIDARQFTDYNEMLLYLKNISEKEYESYLEAIYNHVKSSHFDIFTDEYFINSIYEVVLVDYQNLNKKNTQITAKHAEIVFHAHNETVSPGQQSLANIVVCIGYGPELPVFLRARSLWEFYKSFFPNIEILFVKESKSLGPGEVFFDGYDLNIGMPKAPITQSSLSGDYASTGVWSGNENWRQIYRQLATQNYLLRSRKGSFYVYNATVTSVVDLRYISALISYLPKEKCFAGMPGSMATPKELKGLTFVCGTNTIISSDILELMQSRFDPDHLFSQYPNDVWAALIFPDIDRMALPFFTFKKPRQQGAIRDKIALLTNNLLEQGIFHFRIKTTGQELGLYKREDIDPWIMYTVMETIINSSVNENLKGMFSALSESMLPINSFKFSSSISDGSLFSGKRTLPFSDEEFDPY